MSIPSSTVICLLLVVVGRCCQVLADDTPVHSAPADKEDDDDSCSIDGYHSSTDSNHHHRNEAPLSMQRIIVGQPPFESTILVLDNFLNESFMQNLLTEYLWNASTPWQPVIPHHRPAYEQQQQQPRAAVDHNRLFQAPPPSPNQGGFPGLRTNLTTAYHQALHEVVLTQLTPAMIQDVTGRPIPNDQLRWSTMDSFFGNLCYDPVSLSLTQRVPHIDQGHVVEQRRPVQMALVHYLSPHFPGTGGTAFYAETASGGNRFRYQDCQELKANAKEKFPKGTTALLEASSCHCRPHNKQCGDYQWYIDKFRHWTPPTYMGTPKHEEHYLLLHHVPYRYNRAVLYDARQLHSAYVESVEHLSCAATQGRLTANVFLG